MEGVVPSSPPLSPPPPGGTSSQLRKRPRSSPGIEGIGYGRQSNDGLGAFGRAPTPLSDPDIDINAQASKRYLSEVMANSLTRRVSLKPSGGSGGALADEGGPMHTPHMYAHPLTPPGGSSPQRTGLSEMSDGPDGTDANQPMLMSDVSGNNKHLESTSESTATDSDLLADERADAMGALPLGWGAGAGAGGGAGGGLVAHGQAHGQGPGTPNSARRTSEVGGTGAGAGGYAPRLSNGGNSSSNMLWGLIMAKGGPMAELPSSPSDSRFGGLDLRKTALLRSITRRAEEPAPEAGARCLGGAPAGGGGGGHGGLGAGSPHAAAGAGGHRLGCATWGAGGSPGGAAGSGPAADMAGAHAGPPGGGAAEGLEGLGPAGAAAVAAAVPPGLVVGLLGAPCGSPMRAVSRSDSIVSDGMETSSTSGDQPGPGGDVEQAAGGQQQRGAPRGEAGALGGAAAGVGRLGAAAPMFGVFVAPGPACGAHGALAGHVCGGAGDGDVALEAGDAAGGDADAGPLPVTVMRSAHSSSAAPGARAPGAALPVFGGFFPHQPQQKQR